MSKQVKYTKQGVRDLNEKQRDGRTPYQIPHRCFDHAVSEQIGRGAWAERCSICGTDLGSGDDY